MSAVWAQRMIQSGSKAASRHRLILQIDEIARQICFARDSWTCQRCGEKCHGYSDRFPLGPEWAHVIGRRDLSLRWVLDNNLTLCHEDHVWFDDHKNDSLVWFEVEWPERMNRIRHLRNTLTAKMTMDFLLMLRDQLKAVLEPQWSRA